MNRARSPIAGGVVLGAAVGVFGVAFGVLATTSGLSVAQACAMSVLVFTGASQFLAVRVVADGGVPAAAIAGALLLAARNGVYGMAMSRVVRGSRGRRMIAAQLVIDESTAMAAAQDDPAARERAFWATGLAVFVFWNAGTIAGAVLGRGIGDPAALGLDAAFPAGFVALLLPHLRTRPGRVAAGIGGTAALALVPFVPAGVPILVASLATLVGLRRPT